MTTWDLICYCMRFVKTFAIPALRALVLLQFMVLAVSASAAQQPARSLWAAEWLREGVDSRALGFLRLRDGVLSFAVQTGPVGWELKLADVKSVSVSDARSFTVESQTGEKYVMVAMEANLTPASPKKVVKALEDALKDARSLRMERD